MTLRQLTVTAALLFLMWTGLSFAWPAGELRDYGSFVASGRAAARGDNPYGIHPLTFHVVLPGFDVWNPNLNPPVSLPVFALFDRIEPYTGFRTWWVISLGCYLLAVMLLLHHGRRRRDWRLAGWALALAGFWDTLALGQIYLPLVLAATGAWLLLDRNRPLAAGVLIGLLVAVKPNFAVWPGLLLLSGQVGVAAAAAVTIAVLWTVPLVLYGPSVYRQWVELLLTDTGRGAFITNASLPGLAQRMDLAPAGSIISTVFLVMLAVWAVRQQPGRLDVSAVGLLGGIVASPIAWVHYTLFLLPVFFTRRWNPLMLAAAVLLTVPVPWVLSTLGAPAWQQLTLGSVYSWAVLLCAAGMIMKPDAGLAQRRPDARSAWRTWLSSSTTSTTPS